MKARNRIYKWLIALWLLMSCQPALCAFQSATPPAAWGTRPTLSTDREMAYQFRSTSAYTLTTNTSVYAPGTSSPYGNTVKRARKGGIDDEEDPEDPGGDPQGYIDTPIGSPLVLLLMAVLYLFYAKRKKIQEKFAYSKKKQ